MDLKLRKELVSLVLDNTSDITKLTRLGWSPKNDIHKYLKRKLDGRTKLKNNAQGLLS